MIFEAKDISKRYGESIVLDNVDFEINQGQGRQHCWIF